MRKFILTATIAGNTLIKCGTTRTIGVAAPITGDAASLGLQQLRWAQFFVSRYNKSHKNKLSIVQGDTQLPNTAQALATAHQFASNSAMLALVGPAGIQKLLRASGTTVTRDHVSQNVSDFSSLITRIPSSTQIVYLPWQLAPKAQIFFNQLRAAGKKAIVFGSDGLFAPGTFNAVGSYVSAFPIDFNSAALKAYQRGHGGKPEAFGLPSYTAALVNATAIDKACKNGTASRAEVRKYVKRTRLTAAKTLLGFPVRFLSRNAGASQGAGDMAKPADFAVFHIVSGGKYVRVG